MKKIAALLLALLSPMVVLGQGATLPFGGQLPQIAPAAFLCNPTLVTASPIACSALDGVSVGATTPSTGAFTAITDTAISGSTQCVQANSSGVLSGTGSACGGSGSTGANPTGTVGLAAVNGVSSSFLRADGAPALSQSITPTWTGLHTFTNSDLAMLGSSTGKTTFSSANAGASNFTLTFPAITDTLATLTSAQTLTNKTITSAANTLTIDCSISSCLHVPDATFDVICTNGATGSVDAALISSAIDAASAAGGGVVYLTGPGCKVNARKLIPSNVTVDGGRIPFTLAAAGNWASSTILSAFGCVDLGHDITLTHFNADLTGAPANNKLLACQGDTTVTTYTRLHFTDNYVLTPGDGVAFAAVSDSTVTGNYIANCAGACIDFWSLGSNAIITNNTVKVGVGAGIGIIYTAFKTDNVTATNKMYANIANNYVELDNPSGVGIGIYLQGQEATACSFGTTNDAYNHVSGNTIVGAIGQQSLPIWADLCDYYTTIDHNIIIGDGSTVNTHYAISAGGSTVGVMIEDNIAQGYFAPTAAINEQGVFNNRGVDGSLINNKSFNGSSVLTNTYKLDPTTMVYGNIGGTAGASGTLAFTNPVTFASTALITGNLTLGGAAQLNWNSGRGILTSPGAGTIIFGAAAAASPVDQTILTQSSRAGTDVDTSGANLLIASGQGTGAGPVTTINFSTSNLGSTGTAAQSYGGRLLLSQGIVEVGSGSTIDWAGRGIFTSPASGQIQLGAADAASPANEQLRTQGSRGGTDTNVAGGNLTLQSGLGTGSATGSTLTLRTPTAGSTGTTAETTVNGLVLADTAISVGNATSNPTLSVLGSGKISLNGLVSVGTKFTTSGCSVSSTTGGATAGIFTLGTNSCTVVITPQGATGLTATNGWHCEAHDRTAPTVLIGGESSSTTTTASIIIPAGAGATDVISFGCTGF